MSLDPIALPEELLSLRALVQNLRALAKRFEKRQMAISGDLRKAEDAGFLIANVAWIYPALPRAKRTDKELCVSVWTDDGEKVLTIALRPDRTADVCVANAIDAAKRRAKALPLIHRRLAELEERQAALLFRTNEARDLLSAWEMELDAPEPPKATREQTAPFREQAIRMLEDLDASFGNEWRRQRERKQSSERKAPYRTFRSRQGVPIWVGRDARRNDTLTQKVAKPHHLWLHARGAPGSHVVLAHAKGAVLTSENLLDAAHLAVHFSSLTKEVLLEVTYAEKRHVRKPRKSPPGAVVVDREKVLVLRVDASLLQSLLQSEEFTG